MVHIDVYIVVIQHESFSFSLYWYEPLNVCVYKWDISWHTTWKCCIVTCILYLSNGALFLCLQSLILTQGGLAEFETVIGLGSA